MTTLRVQDHIYVTVILPWSQKILYDLWKRVKLCTDNSNKVDHAALYSPLSSILNGRICKIDKFFFSILWYDYQFLLIIHFLIIYSLFLSWVEIKDSRRLFDILFLCVVFLSWHLTLFLLLICLQSSFVTITLYFVVATITKYTYWPVSD